jgi:hypothetical protein
VSFRRCSQSIRIEACSGNCHVFFGVLKRESLPTPGLWWFDCSDGTTIGPVGPITITPFTSYLPAIHEDYVDERKQGLQE